jgi:hypothetical protein
VMLQARAVGTACVIGSLVFAASASASEVHLDTASANDRTLVFDAGSGEINQVDIELQGSNYTIQDLAGAPMTPAPPCATWALAPGLGTGAMCPAQDVTKINVNVGDQSDQVVLGGITHVLVPALITGGPGSDLLTGGEGPDMIDAFDAAPTPSTAAAVRTPSTPIRSTR